MVLVSIILPIFDERENLDELFVEIHRACASLSYEIIAVDDGSTDGSLDELRRLAADRRVRVVALQRNAGQSAALAAGAERARGEVVLTLDADGQNDPADAPVLVAALCADPDLAAAVGVRVGRHDSSWKRIQSRIANRVRNWLTRDGVRDTGCGLKAVRRAAWRRLPHFDGMHRFLPTLIRLQGGRVVELPVRHRPRRCGMSKYGMWNRAARGMRDALGVRWLSRRRLRYDVREEIG